MHGMHKQMGEVVQLELAILIEVMLALVEDFEVDYWMDVVTVEEKDDIMSLEIFCICSIC